MKPLLILPVENQVRELDAKLLVAVLAAQEGWAAVIGWKGLIDQRIGRFPQGVYVAKSVSQQNTKMLRILRQLGQFVVAWDEEAVVHYPAEIYYSRRIGKVALDFVDLLVAWGEDNRDLLFGHPRCRRNAVHVIGNPRADLLRPEMRGLFQERVDELRGRYGDMILVNTNFGSVNGYHDIQNLMIQDGDGGAWVPGRGSLGMPEGYARGLFDYRRSVFRAFQTLIPEVARAFPERQIVLRPHPAEDHARWRSLLACEPNVHVIAEGNVVPWLLACSCLLHNGCTTAVEGFILGTQIVSYVPEEDPRYEFQLPNALGPRCHDVAAVIDAIRNPPDDRDPGGARGRLVARHIHGLDGGLAAARLIDVLPRRLPDATLARMTLRLAGKISATLRAQKKLASKRAGSDRYSEGFRRQRFPSLDATALQAQAERLRAITGASHPVIVSRMAEDIFEVRAQ